MATSKPLGRGRGRGRGAFFDNKPVTPGPSQGEGDTPPTQKETQPQTAVTVTAVTDEQFKRVEQLSALVADLKVTPVDVMRVKVSILLYGTSDEKCKEAISVLYGRCGVDWHNADEVADICSNLILDNVSKNSNPKKFRELMLQNLQKDFKVKDELSHKKHEQYLGCLAFLCQIVTKCRNEHNRPFEPLLNPTTQALCALLAPGTDEEDLECAAHQLIAVSKCLYELRKEEFKQVVELAKEVILDARGSRTCRKTLLTVVEAYASNWEVSPRLFV